ncbi:MAG TPA: hypothetical protein VFY53_12850 [Rhodoplanes sp.]|nr:hypothetical protein [Rhodoplanes sp.]
MALPAMTAGRQVVEDYRSQGLSLRPHPMAFLRKELSGMGIAPCHSLRHTKDGARVDD